MRLVAFGPTRALSHLEYPLAPGVPVQQAEGMVASAELPVAHGPVGPPATNQAVYGVPVDLENPAFPIILQFADPHAAQVASQAYEAPQHPQAQGAPQHQQGQALAAADNPPMALAVNHFIVENEYFEGDH